MTYSELRASDAERERVVAFLREHALLGRLTDDELEDRIGLAYASVTVGDLEKLIRDSDVMVDFTRGNAKAADYLDSLGDDCLLSAITALELIAGARNQREVTDLDVLISAFEQAPPNDRIAGLVRTLRAHLLAVAEHDPAMGEKEQETKRDGNELGHQRAGSLSSDFT